MITVSNLNEEEQEIQNLKSHRLLKKLQSSTGQGTSMISLILPPKDQIFRAIKLLNTEIGTAVNIKSRVNRLSVQTAITSAIQKLKTINAVPKNGLAIYSGNVMEHKLEKKVVVAIEPASEINTSLYYCDSRFHVESLLEKYGDTTKYGVVVMTGQQTLFSQLVGNTRKVLQSISVDLPKKHGRGGQSSVRFARLRVEKRQAYVRKVAEICNSLYGAEYQGFIFAGPAEFKVELRESNFLRKEIGDRVLKIVDTNYGGDNGLKQAIEQSQEVLKDVKYNKERKVLREFFEEIAGTQKYCIGIKETIENLKNGSVERLIVNDNLEIPYDGTDKEEDFYQETIVDYFSRVYRSFNVHLSLVSDATAEGTQFLEAFGGVGAILKFRANNEFNNTDDSDLDSDDIF